MEKGVINLSDVAIERRIYTVRGEQVMIDRDLAELYGVENRTLRQAVRRNIEKFPDDFLYKLSEDESNEVILKGVSQSVIPLATTQEVCRCTPLRNKVSRCFQPCLRVPMQLLSVLPL